MAYKDKEKEKRALRRYYEKNKLAYFLRNKEKRERMREWLREQKSHPCMDCGVQYDPFVMDFDHRDPVTKKYQPHQLIRLSSWSRLKAEVAKCDLVCANCHRLRTLSQIETKTRQSIWGKPSNLLKRMVPRA